MKYKASALEDHASSLNVKLIFTVLGYVVAGFLLGEALNVLAGEVRAFEQIRSLGRMKFDQQSIYLADQNRLTMCVIIAGAIGFMNALRYRTQAHLLLAVVEIEKHLRYIATCASNSNGHDPRNPVVAETLHRR